MGLGQKLGAGYGGSREGQVQVHLVGVSAPQCPYPLIPVSTQADSYMDPSHSSCLQLSGSQEGVGKEPCTMRAPSAVLAQGQGCVTGGSTLPSHPPPGHY